MNYYGEEMNSWMNDQCGDDTNTFDWSEADENIDEEPLY